MVDKLLEIQDLSIGFSNGQEDRTVVSKVSFEIEEGEILGVVGESGSGKTMSALALMGLLPEAANIHGGKILFEGSDLLKQTPKFLREMKGTKVAMIFQEPMTSFNPTKTIGAQIEEMLRLHQKLTAEEYKEATIQALEEVELQDARLIYHKYPHQLSGGMRQRAMIAMAMIARPKLIIADEPTTALDVTIQSKILDLLKKVNEKYRTSILLISHDLGVIHSICHRAIVMKAGSIVEEGKTKELLLNPKQAYTKALVEAAPITWFQHRKEEIREVEKFPIPEEAKEYILRVDQLYVYYREKTKGMFGKYEKRAIVNGVSFDIKEGETFGVVGESGSGKSTLAKGLCGLIKDVEGKIRWKASEKENIIRPQMVFQDPYGSLNPAKKIKWILEEPLKIKGGLTKEQRQKEIDWVLEEVGLTKEFANRYISQLSGGQRQRIAIAVALICRPRLILLDEPVSSLDVTVQAQIIALLKRLQKQYGLSYLFISHDLNVVYQLCDRVGVMYQGNIIEIKPTKELFLDPREAYSKELLQSSIPKV